LVLISGVIMLTHKKPEPVRAPGTNNNLDRSASRKKVNSPDGKSISGDDDGEEPEEYAMRTPQDNAATGAGGPAGVAGARGTGRERWQVGDVSDEDDESGFGATKWATRKAGGESLIDVHEDGRGHRNSSSSDATITGPAVDPFRDDSEEFVDWEQLDGTKTR
jgi:magnesium transporter